MSARPSGACKHAPYRLALALVLGLAAMPAAAVQPDEVLADPALEARARERFRASCAVSSAGRRISTIRTQRSRATCGFWSANV